MTIEKSQLNKRWRIRTGERQVILLLGDLLCGYLAVFLGLYFWGQKDWLDFSWEFLGQRAPFWFFVLPLLWIILLIEIYDIRKANHKKDVLRGIATAAGFSFVIYLVIFFVSGPNSLPRRGVFIFILAATFSTLFWRLLYISIFTAPVFTRRALIIGAGKAGSTLAEMLRDIQPGPFQLIGFVDDDEEKQNMEINGYQVLGTGPMLTRLIEEHDVTDLIFAISGELNHDLFRSILKVAETDIEVTSMPTLYEEVFGRVPIFLLQSDWILRSFLDQTHTSGAYESIKRLLDILGSLMGLALLLVLYPFIAIAILIESGSPVLYSQMRVGKFGQPYKIFKFRSMFQDAEKDGVQKTATVGDERITRVGKILRRSHIDELPQCWNILKGENSIIGPRAEQIDLAEKFQKELPFYRARLFVRPGLTGWAQVNQRYASTVGDTAVKLEYDLYYIKNRNLLLDLMIIFKTIGTVLGLKGL